MKYEKRPGVYRLQNIVTGSFYIGSTKNLEMRKGSHRAMLIKNRHDNIRIQKDCLDHGVNSFVFGIIEFCEEDVTKEREQYYVDIFKPAYNIWPTVHSAKGRKYTEEQMIKFSQIDFGPKDMEKHSKSLKEAWKRRKESPDYEIFIEKCRNRMTGKRHPEERKKALSMKMKGMVHSKERNEKIRQAHLGRKLIDGHYIKVQECQT